MVKKKSTHGGQRKKAGRKPVEDKKIQVSVYVPKSRIEAFTLDGLRDFIYSAIEKEYKKKGK